MRTRVDHRFLPWSRWVDGSGSRDTLRDSCEGQSRRYIWRLPSMPGAPSFRASGRRTGLMTVDDMLFAALRLYERRLCSGVIWVAFGDSATVAVRSEQLAPCCVRGQVM
jgi:hypothetical protein